MSELPIFEHFLSVGKSQAKSQATFFLLNWAPETRRSTSTTPPCSTSTMGPGRISPEESSCSRGGDDDRNRGRSPSRLALENWQVVGHFRFGTSRLVNTHFILDNVTVFHPTTKYSHHKIGNLNWHWLSRWPSLPALKTRI